MSASAANCDTVSSEQHLPLAADEAAFVPAVSTDSSKLVVLKCNKKYFKSRDCPLRLAELVSNNLGSNLTSIACVLYRNDSGRVHENFSFDFYFIGMTWAGHYSF